jgi:elongation factor G
MAVKSSPSAHAAGPAANPAEIRNIAVVGHGYSGKTILVERLLFSVGPGAGGTTRMGSVEEGNTITDFTDAERQHRHSLEASLVHFRFHDHLINLIDTPGLSDFLGHAIAAMPAAEMVAVVVDAVRGVESGTRRLMTIAKERKLPCMIIVNKIDSPEADLEGVVAQLREQFGAECLPINLPAEGRTRVVNVFDHDGSDDAGNETDFSSVAEAHKSIIEQVVEIEDQLMETYLEKGEQFDAGELHAAFEKCLEQGHLVPICFVSAKTGAGAEDLLHIMADLCPAPTEVNPPEFTIRPEGDAGPEHEFNPDPDPAARIIAHVFKVSTDPFVGKLAVFRVHSGVVRTKAELYVNDNKKPIRVGHLFKLHGKEHVEVQELLPGDIGAVAKIEDIHFNDILHDSHEHDSVRLTPLALPKPMYGLAVELKNHADETKFAGACAKLQEEDPCFRVDRIAATKQTVIRGLGELHLRVVLEKLKNNFNIELNTSTPKTAFKETITARADGHHRHKKQTGGAGQFGEVYLRVEPLPEDHPEGFEFTSEVVGGTVPRQYWPAVEKGIRQVMADGAIAGYPMTGVKAILYDGKYHDVDSKEIAFITAGRKAFIDAINKAKPRLLEPYVNIEITAPSRYMGDITGHISTKRGRVQDSTMIGADTCLVRAVAPLGELQNYSNELKSMTGGQGSYTIEYSHDEHAPPQIQQAEMAAFKPKAEEE